MGRYVRLIVKSWKGHVSLRADVLIVPETVKPPAGKLTRAGVPEDKRTYSSIYGNNKIGTGHARSVINSAQGWSAATNKAGEWIQLDLGKARLVGGTVIQ